MKTSFFFLFSLLLFGCRNEPTSFTDADDQLGDYNLDYITIEPRGLYHGVDFLDEAYGFVAGNDGRIVKTTDGGRTWDLRNSTSGLWLTDVEVIDRDVVVVVGDNVILRSEDGGATWSEVYRPDRDIEIMSVDFADEQLGYAVGGRYVLRTTDGGKTWERKEYTAVGGPLLDILSIGTDIAFITSLKDNFLRTGNRGDVWQLHDLPDGPEGDRRFYTMATDNADNWYAAGEDHIVKSTDQGNSWSLLEHSPSNIRRMMMGSDGRGLAFGAGHYSGGDFGDEYGSIFYTTDGGASWSGSYDMKKSRTIESISFLYPEFGYALGGDVLIRITRMSQE